MLEPLLPPPKPGGRPVKYPRRVVVNAIRYVLRTGCSSRMLPHDLPPWRTAFHYFSTWRRDGTWQRAHDTLRSRTRQSEGRRASPSAAIIDSQSVKTTERGAKRLRCGQEGEGAQAPHSGRYPGAVVGSGGASGQHSGSGRSQAGIKGHGGAISPVKGNLGRRGLRRQAGAVGRGSGWLESGVGAPTPAATYLPGTASALDSGAHLWLAEPATAIEQGL